MEKQLISIRLDKNLLDSVDSICEDWNKHSCYLKTKTRNYYRADEGHLSRAKVIEWALEYYIHNCCEDSDD